MRGGRTFPVIVSVNSDGPIAFDFEIFERFTRVLGTSLVTCTTPLGDSMRYRP